jgi:DNA replication protein DnaC
MDRNTALLKTQLQDLHLTYALETFETMAKEAAAAGTPHLEYLQRLIGGETARRFENLVARRVRQARMPFIKTLDQFRWSLPRKIDRTLVQTLHRLDFLGDKSNVIFVGTVGVGKTHLMLSLANAACAAGYSVRFTTAANIVNTLTAAQIAGRLPRELRQFTAPQLLCIDELGFVPLDKTGADLFFQVISERYEKGAIALTTNRLYKQWPITFNNDSVFTSALLDRLLHHSHTVIIEGPSGRGPKHRLDSEA